METRELKIDVPEGYEIDKEKSTFEHIVLRKISNSLPRSWDEYCRQQKDMGLTGYYLNNTKINECSWRDMSIPSNWSSVLPSRELAEAVCALMQLMSLRQAWIGDWEPNWDGYTCHHCIVTIENKYCVQQYYDSYRALSFPTSEKAEDFMNTFKDLLEIAKSLI